MAKQTDTSSGQWHDGLDDESDAVRTWRWRFAEARQVGLDRNQAFAFATGDGDLERLRQAAKHGATVNQLAKIFL